MSQSLDDLIDREARRSLFTSVVVKSPYINPNTKNWMIWDSRLKTYVDSGEHSGTNDYSELSNKPKLNNVELVGNKTSTDLGIASKSDIFWEKGSGVHSIQSIGSDCNALGESSVAEGYMTHAGLSQKVEGWSEGKGAHAEGGNTTAAGNFSHAEGGHTVANNPYEHAEGLFNYSHYDQSIYPSANNTIHSIGVGTNTSNRKNAVEVMQNGDVYVLGVGGYDGSNIESARTLQDVLSDLV